MQPCIPSCGKYRAATGRCWPGHTCSTWLGQEDRRSYRHSCGPESPDRQFSIGIRTMLLLRCQVILLCSLCPAWTLESSFISTRIWKQIQCLLAFYGWLKFSYGHLRHAFLACFFLGWGDCWEAGMEAGGLWTVHTFLDIWHPGEVVSS